MIEQDEPLACPICGHSAHVEAFTTGENINCYFCGYHRTLEFDGPFIAKHEEIEGCGGYIVKTKMSDGIEAGSFGLPSSELEFLDLCEHRQQDIDYARYTTWDGNEMKYIDVVTQQD